MTRLRPRTARTAAAGLVLAAALAVTGCSATNPITTIGDYEASDGAGTTVGSVRVQNMLVVAAAEGAPGVLSGALANRGADDEDVTLTVGDSEPVRVTIPASGSVLVGVSDAPARYGTLDVPVASVDTAPGGLTTLTITTSGGGTVELPVPVFDGSLPEYAALVPTPGAGDRSEATPTARPTADATQDASEPEGDEGGDTEG
ncbi:hypothetical protein [Cellulomonas sp. S1-8]|uniref:hypothetical protein n=1 Tax=Cellulomonas sp. S1-8 TaxID=2904790 RepID=UPI0022430303|nr:hypothetical protein [Cellulomonas sp. S1-8]UZN04040.1 hypothetical protein OKX07_03635 [Cellulomonas sp. S1-8]